MNPAIFAALPGIISAAGGAFGLFGGNKRNYEAPMNAANAHLDRIPGETNPYYQPYINSGRDSLKTLQDQYGNLLNNPNEMYNKFSSGYKESPGYQTRLEEALRAITNSEAAGGMAGSPEHQQLAAGKALDLRSEDFEKYLEHVFGLYGKGLSGTEGLNEQGYGASTDYGNMLANIRGQKAKMAYETGNAMNTGRGQDFSNLIGGAGAAATGYNSYLNHQDVLKLLANTGGR